MDKINNKKEPGLAVTKRYFDEPDWNQTTIDEMLDHTEDSGYYKRGTVLNIIESGEKVQTPNAEWKKL